MKRHSLILIVLIVGFLGCEVIDELTKFNINFEQSITIPPNTIINTPIDIITPDIETNSESTFGSNNTSKELIEDVRLKTLDLTITSPSNSDFTFLKSIDIYISADGLPEIKVAFKDDVPDTVGSILSLDVVNDDLKEYIKKDKFKVRLNTVFDKSINTEHKINFEAVFFVDAKILGV